MGPRRLTTGFTLIEVLAAMMVLSILVLLLGRLFADSSNVWRAGTQRTDLDGSARALLDFMSYELGQAAVDDLLPMVVRSNAVTNQLGLASDGLRFITMCNKAERRGTNTYRDTMAVTYLVSTVVTGDTVGLWRRVSEQFNAGSGPIASVYARDYGWYSSPLSISGGDSNVVSPEVIRFKVSVATVQNISAGGQTVQAAGYDSRQHGLPIWADVYVELMAPADALQALLLSGTDRADFIRRRARAYSTRVFLQNRQQPISY